MRHLTPSTPARQLLRLIYADAVSVLFDVRQSLRETIILGPGLPTLNIGLQICLVDRYIMSFLVIRWWIKSFSGQNYLRARWELICGALRVFCAKPRKLFCFSLQSTLLIFLWWVKFSSQKYPRGMNSYAARCASFARFKIIKNHRVTFAFLPKVHIMIV